MELLGTRIGGYVVHRLLSDAGGMGTVWEARHNLEPKRRAVVKIIRPELLPRVDMVERFLREAVAGMQVKHRHLVEIYDVAQLADGRPYILMEFLDGGDLEGYLASYQKLGAEDALRILAQIADGLEVLHAAGIVHRDLKPSNVFLVEGEARLVKIVDFGLAKAPSSTGARLTHAGFVAGSPYYVAPEQVVDFAGVDGRADIYALSMIAVRMIAGRLPYAVDGSNASNPLLAALNNQRDNPFLARQVLELEAAHDVPHGWFPILERGIAVHVDARIQRVRELVFALADELPDGERIVRAVAGDLYQRASPVDATRKNASDRPPTAVLTVGAPPPAPPLTGSHGTTTHGAAAGAIESRGGQPAPSSPLRRFAAFAAVGLAVVAAALGLALGRGRDDERRGDAPPAASSTEPRANDQPEALSSPPPALSLRRVRVETEPAGAIVSLDGETLGPAPAIAALPEGSTVVIRAELAGYASAETRVVVAEGSVARLELVALVDAGVPGVGRTDTANAEKRRRASLRVKKVGTAATSERKAEPANDDGVRPSKTLDLGSAAGPR